MLLGGTATHLFLISPAMVMKACSTLVAFLALVSRNGMPISSAKTCMHDVAADDADYPTSGASVHGGAFDNHT